MLRILFAAVSFAAILEYILVCGMFTGTIAMLCVLVVGIANIALSIKEQEWFIAVLFLIAIISLCMGYWKLMF